VEEGRSPLILQPMAKRGGNILLLDRKSNLILDLIENVAG
jgi:hypothetical protein